MPEAAKPRGVEVKPIEQHPLQMLLNSGEQWVIDLNPVLQLRDTYWRLWKVRYFAQVSFEPGLRTSPTATANRLPTPAST